jgi:multicomponent K+:H+ antiporter subunit D
MSRLHDHLAIAPILIPLLAGIVLVLIGERRRLLAAGLGIAAVVVHLVAALLLLEAADTPVTLVYRLGDWPALFAIVLVADRLSALMLVLTGVLGLAALVFSLARWHGAGSFFHPLFQFQLMGISGAFLTGDVFNLFVFFEVMLAASYGMALHGSGTARVRHGLHYIVVNLVASLLFLIGVSVVYGIAGTLNMADLAARMRAIAAADRGLLEAGIAVLGVAFLIKAAMWPLGFWLPSTYAAASPPAAALLSVLSKVGIYAVLRVWLLLFGDAGEDAGVFDGDWLVAGGLATIAFGSIAVLATQNMSRLAGACVLVSSGTLLAAIGTGDVAVTAGALFYLTASVLSIAAFFLLIELVDRGREAGADVLAVTRAAFGTGDDEEAGPEDSIGIAFPGTIAILGFSFVACALMLAGLPPLAGFLAKFAILVPLLGSQAPVSLTAWTMLAALLVSGLATLVAMTRAGIDAFWTAPADIVQRVAVVEIVPIIMLLALCAALTLGAGPVMDFMTATAQALHAPQDYLRGVLDAAAGAGR